MIKVLGYYRTSEVGHSLIVPLDKANFDCLVDHITKNMFFAYRRIAPKYKSILLNSIGDHLDLSDNQSLTNAEVCVEVTVKHELKKEHIDKLDESHTWYICAMNGETEAFMFSIDKDTQYIKDRRLIKC